MKCIKKNDKVRRVTNNSAEMLINEGWVYCPKSEFKKGLKEGKNKTEHAEQPVKKVKKAGKVKKQKKVATETETVTQ